MHIDQAIFSPRGAVDIFFYGLADAAHGDDYMLRVRCSIVVEQAIVGAQPSIDFGKLLFHDFRQRQIIGIGRFPGLEKDIGILRRTIHFSVRWMQGTLTEADQGLGKGRFLCRIRISVFFQQQALQVLILPDLYLVQLMGGAEPVEEIQERDPSFDGRQMGHRGQVHDLLHAAFREKSHACLAAGIDVGMVSEDGQGVGGNGSGGHMDDAGEQFARHAVQIGQHQQQPLGGCESGGERTGQQRAVDGGGSPGFGLHLRDGHGLAEYIFPALSRPFIAELRHGGGGGDGVDGRGFAVGICHMSRGLIAVHGAGGPSVLGQGMSRVYCVPHKK